jgi:single-strand DNA-binding protein
VKAVTVLHGRLVSEPTLRFTNSGTAVANLRVVTRDRVKDRDGTWKDGDEMFYTIVAFQDQAENICENLVKGDMVLASGAMRQQTWTDKEGNDRVTFELVADVVGKSLRWKPRDQDQPSQPRTQERPRQQRQRSEPDYPDAPPF